MSAPGIPRRTRRTTRCWGTSPSRSPHAQAPLPRRRSDTPTPVGDGPRRVVVATVVFAVSPVVTSYDSFATFRRRCASSTGTRCRSTRISTCRCWRATRWPAHGHLRAPTRGPSALRDSGGHRRRPGPPRRGPSAGSIAANQSQLGALIQLWTASVVTGMACGALALLAYRRLQRAGEDTPTLGPHLRACLRVRHERLVDRLEGAMGTRPVAAVPRHRPGGARPPLPERRERIMHSDVDSVWAPGRRRAGPSPGP